MATVHIGFWVKAVIVPSGRNRGRELRKVVQGYFGGAK